MLVLSEGETRCHARGVSAYDPAHSRPLDVHPPCVDRRVLWCRRELLHGLHVLSNGIAACQYEIHHGIVDAFVGVGWKCCYPYIDPHFVIQ